MRLLYALRHEMSKRLVAPKGASHVGSMILLLSGTINSGKTTCARLLARHVPPAAILEADMFFSAFPDRPFSDAGSDCVRAAAASARALALGGYHVIVPYPLWEEDVRIALSYFCGMPVPIHMVTLAPRASIVLGPRSTRDDKAWERDMVAWHKELGVPHPAYGAVVDNSDQTPSQTVGSILSHIQSGSSYIHPVQYEFFGVVDVWRR